MNFIFLELLTPELVNITKPKFNKLISYGNVDFKLIYSLTWIYKYYFEQPVHLFLPTCVNINETLEKFNECVGDFPLTQEEIQHCSLESIENTDLKQNKVLIYGFGDFIFNELSILNKRRTNTQLKNIKGKIHVLSYTSLKCLDLVAFDSFEYNQIKINEFNFNYIDLIDQDEELFESNVESFVDFISDLGDKNIYISLCISVPKIIQIEKALKERNINVSRKEKESGVVINASKTIEKSFLKNTYDIYILICPEFEYPLNILYYLKEIHNADVYMDSSRVSNIHSCLKKIKIDQIERTLVKDSTEFESYNDLIKEINVESVVVSENYYTFDCPENIKKLNLCNLTKKDYDTIRQYVKVKLSGKYDIDIKTCQLSAPCSPKDRSKKLNSLSNKISSYDYRCDVTCEIFKDYTIGVVVWNEMFANRKDIDVVKNQVYIHQTTSGTWKYTSVS
jgi:hypothetical protein